MSTSRRLIAVLCGLACGLRVLAADLLINEVLFNPPGADSPAEFLEFRGTPNSIVPPGTFFVAVEGDAAANPGTIQNVFDLSGLRVGGNGLLVLLQKNSPYAPDSRAAVLTNTNSGPGWGTGAGSSVAHQGNAGITALKNASATFFLVRAPQIPLPGTDIDANDDGVPEGGIFAAWTVLDSVGVLDSDGAGDFAYGAINFRRDTLPGSGAGASGVVVPVGFTAGYVGRAGNSSGSSSVDWVAGGSLDGAAPVWVLSAGNTFPANMAGVPLDHLGAPNFGAPALPGVLLAENPGGTFLDEGGGSASYSLTLNTMPDGPVVIRISCPPDLEASVDNGSSFGPVRDLVITDAAPRQVAIRAPADDVLDPSPRWRCVTNSIISSSDLIQYPLTALVPPAWARVREKDSVLLNELKVNPPGTNDGPYEYVELRGPAGHLLRGVCVLAVDGNAANDPGLVVWKSDLTGVRMGLNGVLLIASPNHPYAVPAATTVVPDPAMSPPAGVLGNGSISFLLLSTAASINVGDDLDRGNNGVLEGLPADALILDAVGWTDGDGKDIVYGGADLTLAHGTPDAATRLPWDDTPRRSAAWICGDLQAGGGETVAYDPVSVSAGFPTGTLLSPGAANNVAPAVSGLMPISGVIGDPYNPMISFVVSDDQTSPAAIMVTATSSNPAVVPTSNLVVTAGAGGGRVLSMDPLGVGYADITLWLNDGSQTGQVTFPYAASAPGRPGGIWHAGSSDASTAIPVDDRFMLVGDDENQIIRLYDRQRSGLALNQFDMTPFLGLPDAQSGMPREVDVEASTRAGNRLFWMGSLGHAATGESRTNRTRVFATDLSGSGASVQLTYAGRYDFLKVDLIDWDVRNLHGRGSNYFGLEASDAEGVPPKAPDGSGFAIEGLAMMPGSTNGAFVAFRAPIVPATNRTYALIVPVLNFGTLAASGGPPGSAIFGLPIELDLYGRGVRSIEGDTNGYFIVAGPAGAHVGRYPRDFRLYTWTGSSDGQPQQRTADLRELNPEGIVGLPALPWTSETTLQLLSDGGATDYYGDGTQAKFLRVPNFKKFRSDRVAIGATVKPAPVIVSASLEGDLATIRWRSLKNESYLLEYCTDLGSPNWVEIEGRVTAAGPFTSKSVTVGTPMIFYRVTLLP